MPKRTLCEIMVNWHESSETLASKAKVRTPGLSPARKAGGIANLYVVEHKSGLRVIARVVQDLLGILTQEIYRLASKQGNLISGPVKFTQKSLMVVDSYAFHQADNQSGSCSKWQSLSISLRQQQQRRPFQKFSQADSYS